MITTLIGKTFLKAYNDKYSKSYSAKEYFEKEYFELFFNHPKYMQWVTNSPFVQMKTGQKPETLCLEDRLEKLQNLYEKAGNGSADASFALGYPASETKEYASTSGLVSDITIEATEEDIFYSWIGSGLGIGVSGGFTLLINDENILLETYTGWQHYRKYLNDSALQKLRGNQINSWNGQWLTYKLGKEYRDDFDFTTLTKEGIFKAESTLAEVNTVNWSNLFFSLSQFYPDKILNAYVYSFGQTNKTIGFIPIHLKSGRKLKEVFKKIFHSDKEFETKDFQSLFGIHIKRACELGNIGLHALRPDSLKKYMNEEKSISFKKEEDFINYQSYKTWLVAMLSKNKEEITEYTLKIADVLLKYRNTGKGNTRITLIEKELFQAKSKKGFLDSLTTVIQDSDNDFLDELKKLRDEIHLMTNEEFGYFLTLLKFDYVFIQRKS